MFSKLISRFQEKKSDHPLGSDANLEALIGDMPTNDPARLLFEVDHWLAGMDGHAAEIGAEHAHRALIKLDQFSWPASNDLLTRYLGGNKRDYLAESIWAALDHHATQLFHYHSVALNQLAAKAESEADKARMARSAAAALRAWSLNKKLQHFRYRNVPQTFWLAAHELLRLLTRLGLQQISVVPYHDEAPTTALAEYTIGLYLDCLPLGNLLPQQLEFADRFLRTCVPLELASQAHAGSSYRVDLQAAEGPRRLRADDTGGPGVRYCSSVKLRATLLKLSLQVKNQSDLPAWLVTLPAHREQIDGVLLLLMQHWAPTPPHRSGNRFDQDTELRVIFSFDLARRMIACSQFARMGRNLNYDALDVNRLFDEARFGRDNTAASAEPEVTDDQEQAMVSPLDILRKLELAGDTARMETWRQVDGSDTGIGATVPAILSRHRIGELIALRYVDGLEWHLAIIRRIGRDAANLPSIGLETLAWPSICAQVKLASAGPAGGFGGGTPWLDAILVSHGGDELILPAGTFRAGLEMDFRSEEERSLLKLQTLIERGTDYDYAKFTRIA